MHESTLADYTFLPWLRQGIGSEIANPDDGATLVGERAAVPVQFKVNGENVLKQVELVGPGDIVGINPRAIVKTEPRNWITNFEPNYLPHIEFYEEDFPWRYTPAAAVGELSQSRLRPWLFLIVLAEDEFKDKKTTGPLPAIEITAPPETVFPQPGQIWAWAHVHVSKNLIDGATTAPDAASAAAAADRLETVQSSNPDNALSRLICPRALKANTAYHAFLVPSFETGRLAGLGEKNTGVDALESSWGNAQTDYPVYFRWYFRTGQNGDFEKLARQLKPRPVDKRVGIRDMDMQSPGYEVQGISGDFSVLGLEGALKSPETKSYPEQWPPAGADFNNPPSGSAENFLLQLQQKVNLQVDIQQQESAGNPHPDPFISPPLYGKWHALVEKLAIEEPGWVNGLNKDPRFRTAAGFGTNVIQANQEKFMQIAWSQLGDLLQANQKIRQLQLSLTASFHLYRKHIQPLTQPELMQLTLPVQARILGSPTTIAQQVKESRLPAAALDPAFRKLTRPKGRIGRKSLNANSPKPAEIVSLLNNNRLSAAPVLAKNGRQLNLDAIARNLPGAQWPEWLKKLLTQKSLRWVLAGLILVAALLEPFLGIAGTGFQVAALSALLYYTERVRRSLSVVNSTAENNWVPETVDLVPARSNFNLADYGATTVAQNSTSASTDSVEAAHFRTALKDLHAAVQAEPEAPPPLPAFEMNNADKKIRTAINPVTAISKRAKYLVRIPDSITGKYSKPPKTLATVMAHPVYANPMYQPLRDISAEFLVPNLHLIPQDTISLMLVNEQFIESYMAGVNHEMGRELLWREYPTDQRGSYFRQFWDVGDRVNRDFSKSAKEIEEALLDIKPLHTWAPSSELGSHGNLPQIPGEERLVVVIKGELTKRYPTLVVFAQKAMWSTDEQGNDIRVLDDSDPANNLQSPLFKAEIEPDIKFLGFDLTVPAVKGSATRQDNIPGWFIVVQERPGEPRFGLDEKSEDTPDFASEWNDLAWVHLENFDTLNCVDLDKAVATTPVMAAPDNEVQWGRNSADMAYILYQVPTMVAFHAADMLKNEIEELP